MLGSATILVDSLVTGWDRLVCGGCGGPVNGFVLDWGHFVEAALSAAAVVDRLDPVDDLGSEFGSGGPVITVQDVVL